jgi:hypothetical protein
MRWEFVFSLQKTAETERFTASEERGVAARLEGWRQARCLRPSFETPTFGRLLRMRGFI